MLEMRPVLAEAARGAPGDEAGAPGAVVLQEHAVHSLIQVSAWPQTQERVATQLADSLGVDRAPGPGRAVTTSGATIMRIHPLSWWLLDADGPSLDPAQWMTAELGTFLDLGHSRARVALSGPDSSTLLNRFLAIDLRPSVFPIGAVATGAFHHVSVLLHRREQDFHLYMPRGFAVSLFELLAETAAQFGSQVLPSGTH